MTARTVSNRRLLACCITVLCVLTLFIGVYARSGRQVMALQSEMARMQPGGLYDGATTKSPNSSASGAQTARLGAGL